MFGNAFAEMVEQTDTQIDINLLAGWGQGEIALRQTNSPHAASIVLQSTVVYVVSP